MKRLNQCSKHDFIRLFFGLITIAMFVGAVCMPDRNEMFKGLEALLGSTCKAATNAFAIGGYAGTFLSGSLVCLVFTLLFCLPGASASAPSVLGFLLTMGFTLWGVTVLNMVFGILGVLVYCLVKKQAPGKQANAMLFTTALSPLYADLLFRYPNATAQGFSWGGLALAVVVGVVVGFLVPASLSHSPKTHKGFSLYSAAMTLGMIAFFLCAILFRIPGKMTAIAEATGDAKAVVTLPSDAFDNTIASRWIFNGFSIAVFGICVVVAVLMGTKVKDYCKLLKHSGHGVDFVDAFGNGAFLMNVGLYGLFIVAYYNLINLVSNGTQDGVYYNAVALGCVFCMLAGCCSGSHPRNVWPSMLGYAIASFGMKAIANYVGADYAMTLNNQTIVIGLCFCSALSPIAGSYGWLWGTVAAILHYFLVSCVPELHGGFLLYNGGFTACLVCVVFIPVLEHFCKTKAEKKALKEGKSNT